MYKDSIERNKRNNLKKEKASINGKKVTFKNKIIQLNAEWIKKTLYKNKTAWKRKKKIQKKIFRKKINLVEVKEK